MSAVTLQSLGEVAEFVRGITFKPDDVIDPSEAGAIACMRTKNVQTDLDLSDVWAVPSSFVKRAEQFLREGDILVSTANSWNLVGKCCWVPALEQKSTLGGFISALRSTSERLDSRYLYHWFAFDPVQALVRNCARKTTNIANLSFDQCLSLKVPLPPLSEQKRIAAILDQADQLRRKRQRAIDRLNQLGQAIFHDMFGDATANPMGWRTAQLGDIVRSGDKINYGVVQPGEDVENGVPLVRVGDLLSGYIDPSKVKQIDARIEAGYKRSRLVGDEILIGCVGSIGTVALAHEGLRGANIARAVARVPVDPEIAMRDFIAEQIKSPAIQHYFTAETRTVAQPTLNIGLIVSAPIILPPMSEQKKFSRKTSEIRDMIAKSLEYAVKEDALFSSLQHRAFRGEL